MQFIGKNTKKQIVKALNENRKRTRYLIYTLFLAAVILFYGFGDYGLMRYFQLKNEYTAVQNELAELEAESAQLQHEEELLKNRDPEYLQKVAREKFGLVKPGEKIYKLVPNSDTR